MIYEKKLIKKIEFENIKDIKYDAHRSMISEYKSEYQNYIPDCRETHKNQSWEVLILRRIQDAAIEIECAHICLGEAERSLAKARIEVESTEALIQAEQTGARDKAERQDRLTLCDLAVRRPTTVGR
jgi:flagellar biosynthesis chaperone FliJ